MLSRLTALGLFMVGGLLAYSAAWISFFIILPQVRYGGWALWGDVMILNRVWHGDEIYFLVTAYLVVGIASIVTGVVLWRRSRRTTPDAEG